MSRSAKLFWREWNPGLDNGHWSLGDVLSTLPGADSVEIPWIIRLFENPASPVALPGAISLQRHDAVHALLGRGLRPQDEAFVIGFTMGAASSTRNWHLGLFRLVARSLYTGFYRFKAEHILPYDLAVSAAAAMPVRDLQDVPFEELLDRSLGDLRQEFGINVPLLQSYYRKESLLLADSAASRRLDRDIGGVDPSDIVPPRGEPVPWRRTKRR